MRPSGSAAAPWCSIPPRRRPRPLSPPLTTRWPVVRTIPRSRGTAPPTHVLDIPLGDTSVVWTDTYWFTSDGDKLHDTGLTVYSLVSVGRAVLLGYEYGEGNGSEESRADGIARATQLERPVVERMSDL